MWQLFSLCVTCLRLYLSPLPPLSRTTLTGVLSVCLYANTVQQTAKVSRRAKIGANECTHTQVYESKTWAQVVSLDDCHTNAVTGVRFGRDAKWLASVSKDRTLKFYA